MHDEHHPLHGVEPIRAVTRSLSCRFEHDDHRHAVQYYPETAMGQVKWQHQVPATTLLRGLGLTPPTLVFEAETCWYSLHHVPQDDLPPWEVLDAGRWVPFGRGRALASGS